MTQKDKKPGVKQLPIGGAITEPGSSRKYKTGDWRAYRPKIDKAKCADCLLCWMYCPDSAIIRKDNTVEINLDYCKGCGICANECPRKAIIMEEEPK